MAEILLRQGEHYVLQVTKSYANDGGMSYVSYSLKGNPCTVAGNGWMAMSEYRRQRRAGRLIPLRRRDIVAMRILGEIDSTRYSRLIDLL